MTTTEQGIGGLGVGGDLDQAEGRCQALLQKAQNTRFVIHDEHRVQPLLVALGRFVACIVLGERGAHDFVTTCHSIAVSVFCEWLS